MSRICPLFSGSTGNSTYIGTSCGGILVDAGASCKGLCAALEAAGGSLSELRAVAVTHEHIDHVRGLRLLLEKSGAPLVASRETLAALTAGRLIPDRTTVLEIGGETLDLGGVTVSRFATSHDCAGSSGYVFRLPDGKKAAVCTDLGVVTDSVRAALCGCDLVLFESNHDLRMLENGPYPPPLKQRIRSDRGHLSNGACAAELPALLQSGVTRFLLGHLSRKNNLPMLAASAARAALMDAGAAEGRDYILYVSRPSGNEVTVL